MSGLISLQISITGNLEKDQQILLFGIGGLIGLIILAMIIIVIVIIIRRARRNKIQLEAAALPQPVVAGESKYIPAVEQKPVVEKVAEVAKPLPVTEEKKEEKAAKEEIVAPKAEEKKEVVSPIIESKPEPKKEEPKKEEPKKEEPKKEDKLEEIRRRLEEIRSQKSFSESAVILPKIEAAPKEEKIEIQKPLEKTESEIVSEIENEETILVADTEDVAVPIHKGTELEDIHVEDEQTETTEAPSKPETRMVEDEGVMKEISTLEIEVEETISAPQAPTIDAKEDLSSIHLPNGKFLPMKKMTFAEWVELFK